MKMVIKKMLEHGTVQGLMIMMLIMIIIIIMITISVSDPDPYQETIDMDPGSVKN